MKFNRKYAKCNCIKEIKALNKAQGYNFFSPETLGFFKSVIDDEVFGGCVFVTSEQNGYHNPRLYTIRAIRANGTIETLSNFLKKSMHQLQTKTSHRVQQRL